MTRYLVYVHYVHGFLLFSTPSMLVAQIPITAGKMHLLIAVLSTIQVTQRASLWPTTLRSSWDPMVGGKSVVISHPGFPRFVNCEKPGWRLRLWVCLIVKTKPYRIDLW